MLTKLPLNSVKIDSGEPGYILYDVIQNKLVVSNSTNNIGKIKRSGDNLTAPIFYDTVPIEQDNQFVTAQYVQLQIDKILEKVPLYLQKTGGTMQGEVLIATTSEDSKAMVTKGQVDQTMTPSRFIKLEGGTMNEAFMLHSLKPEDYGAYNAVPKFLVDNLIDSARVKFKEDFDKLYLSKTGNTMTGPLYQNPPSEPYERGHIVTFGFLKKYVQEYIRSTDWSCNKEIGKDVVQCITG